MGGWTNLGQLDGQTKGVDSVQCVECVECVWHEILRVYRDARPAKLLGP